MAQFERGTSWRASSAARQPRSWTSVGRPC